MCPACKTPIEDFNQNHCRHCGADLRGLQTTCGICGTGVHMYMLTPGEQEAFNFCGMCGAPWRETTPPSLEWKVAPSSQGARA